jgi:predicted 3-demethylubiquinone-9 3-methyltransferase (glyoxalase superfamily)
MVSKNTICLWYNGTALEAATFYAQTFPDSAVCRPPCAWRLPVGQAG